MLYLDNLITMYLDNLMTIPSCRVSYQRRQVSRDYSANGTGEVRGTKTKLLIGNHYGVRVIIPIVVAILLGAGDALGGLSSNHLGVWLRVNNQQLG